MAKRSDSQLERLIDLDSCRTELRERYQTGVQSQLDRYLASTRSVRYAMIGLGGVVGAIVCGALAITEPDSLPPPLRAIFYLFACFGLAWTVFAGWVVVRGSSEFQAQRRLASRMAFAFALVSVFALAAVSSLSGRPGAGVPLVLMGLTMLLVAAVRFLSGEIERSETVTREHLLRIESRLVALADSIGQSTRPT